MAIRLFDVLELIYCDMYNMIPPQGTTAAFPLSLCDVKQEFPRYLRYFPRK